MMFTIIAVEYEHIKRRAKEMPGNLPGVGLFVDDETNVFLNSPLMRIGVRFDSNGKKQAIFECILDDVGDAVRDRCAGQRFAIYKCPISDFRDAVADDNFAQ